MKNKIIASIVTACVCIATQANAIEFKDLLGTWKGKRTETRAGVGGYSSATFVGKKGSDGGLVITETGTSKWVGSYNLKHTFKKDGTYRMIQTDVGLILSSGSGIWRNKNGTITISGLQRVIGGSAHFTGSIKMPTKTKIVYIGKSGSTSIKITANRQ